MNGPLSISAWFVRSSLAVTLLAWAGLVVAVGVVSVVLAGFGELSASGWIVVRWVPQYYLMALGVWAVAPVLRVLVATGCTRRMALAGMVLYGVVTSVLVTVLVVGTFGLERGLFALAGIEQFTGSDLLASPLVIAETSAKFLLQYLAYFVSGMLIAGCYVRFGGLLGTVALVPAVVPALTAEAATWDVGVLEVLMDSRLLDGAGVLVVPSVLILLSLGAIVAVLRTSPLGPPAALR